MPNPHIVLAAPQVVTSQPIPTERDILELAEMTASVFDSPEAGGLKERLKEQAEVYRDWLRSQQRMKDDAYNLLLGFDEKGRKRVASGIGLYRAFPDPESLTFLLALVLTCPQLLSQPAGFEWVLQDLIQVLVTRRLDPKSDRIFANAMNTARVRSRVGPPKDKALEYFRYTAITELMHPSVVIPDVKSLKLNKTKAVQFVAALEKRLAKREEERETRSIWRAHKRVKRFTQRLTEHVQANSSRVPPPTKNLDREPQERAKDTEKGSRRAAHPKRVKRK